MKRLAITALAIVATLSGLLVLVASTLPRATEPVAATVEAPPPAQPQPAVFEIQLSSQYGPTTPSDPNVKFSGGCWDNGAFASVSGITPKTFAYTATSISCTFQKQGANSLAAQGDGHARRRTRPADRDRTDHGVVSFVV